MEKFLRTVSFFGFTLLLTLGIFATGKYLFQETIYTKAASRLEELIDDVHTLRARQQLNQIQNSSANIQRLIAFCIKHEVTPPVRISDMKSCRISALNYYSLPVDEEGLKKIAARPLKDQLYFSKEIKPYLEKINKE